MKIISKKFLLNNYQFIILFLLSLIFIILYSRSLNFGFISDDFDNLMDYKIFLNPLTSNRWMPIQGGLYWLINILHLAPVYIRVFFMAIQIINIVLVFQIIYFLTKNKNISLIATFIYVFFYRMPMVIVWIPGFLEISVAFFFLMTIYLFILSIKLKSILFYLLSIVTFVLALLSKESSITLPIFLLLIEILIFNKVKKSKIKYFIIRYLPFFIILLTYFLIIYFTSDHTKGLITRGGYNSLSFTNGLTNYINILISFLPIKINQIVISNFWYILLLLIPIYFALVLFFTLKNIPKIIPLLYSIILLGIIPQAFFSPSGPQDRHPYLFFFAFAGLIAIIVYSLAEKVHLKSQIIVIFCIIWVSFSLRIILERNQQWQLSNEITQSSQNKVRSVCGSISQNSIVYLVNFPQFIDNQVYIFNNGLGNMLRFTCSNNQFNRIETIYNNKQIYLFLKNSSDTHQVKDKQIIFAYEDGVVKDYSNKYKYFENFLHSQLSKKQIETAMSSIEDTYIWNYNPDDKIFLKQDSDSTVIQYTLSPNGWNAMTHRNIPILPDTSGFSIEVFGDAQNELLGFQFVDKETDNYFIFTQRIDWNGWKNISFEYNSGILEGNNNISFNNVDDLNIAISSDKNISGEIKIKDFKEY